MSGDMQQGRRGKERKGKEKREKGKILTLRAIRTTHLLLSEQMSYPVRLEGHMII